jgi:hypothetical protein
VPSGFVAASPPPAADPGPGTTCGTVVPGATRSPRPVFSSKSPVRPKRLAECLAPRLQDEGKGLKSGNRETAGAEPHRTAKRRGRWGRGPTEQQACGPTGQQNGGAGGAGAPPNNKPAAPPNNKPAAPPNTQNPGPHSVGPGPHRANKTAGPGPHPTARLRGRGPTEQQDRRPTEQT